MYAEAKRKLNDVLKEGMASMGLPLAELLDEACITIIYA